MRRIAFWSSLIFPALAVVWGAWFGSFPLGVPGEWVWGRAEPVGSAVLLSFVMPSVTAMIYIGFVGMGARRIERSRAAEMSAWMCGLIVCGFTWLWIVQESAPEAYQLSKSAWVLYFRGSSGYFLEARDAAGDLPAYLADYERKMAEGDVLHIGTHPPGLTIVFRALLSVCESNPRLVDVVLAIEPDSVREAFGELRQTAIRAPHSLERAHEAVLWLATLLLQAGVALTLLPLFGLLRRTLPRRASWLAAAFWPTIPALAVFIPKSDCLYPLLATGFLWLWLTCLARRSPVLSALAGFIFWLGMVLSLAFLPVAFIALLLTIRDVWRRHVESDDKARKSEQTRGVDRLLASRNLSDGLKSCLASIAWAAAGLATPTLVAWCILKINLPAVWWLNFQNHARFYDQYSRTYWKWQLMNPVEFAVAAGVPLVILAAWSLLRQWRLSGVRLTEPAWAWLATISLLWLSGKNLGETARLWIVFMPFLVWIAGPLFDRPAAVADDRPPPPEGRLAPVDNGFLSGAAWIPALALQLATTTAIVTRVVGFHYP